MSIPAFLHAQPSRCLSSHFVPHLASLTDRRPLVFTASHLPFYRNRVCDNTNHIKTMLHPPPMPAFDMDGPYLYFSYGSNLSREKLRTRGEAKLPPIQFTRTWIGRLTDWQLCFDLRGAPPVEPAMGSIRRKPGDEVYGLVYELKTRSCWEKLLQSEGVTTRPERDSYWVIEVEVECYERDRPEERVLRKVRTLMTNERHKVGKNIEDSVKPSRRYVNILITGAECEGLPVEYVERLRRIEVARRWKQSPLLVIMTLAIPMIFMMRRWNLWRFVIVVSRLGMWLYARHERIMLKKERGVWEGMELISVRLALFGLYLMWAGMTMVMYLVNKRTRGTIKRINVLLKEEVQDGQKAKKQQVVVARKKVVEGVATVEKGVEGA